MSLTLSASWIRDMGFLLLIDERRCGNHGSRHRRLSMIDVHRSFGDDSGMAARGPALPLVDVTAACCAPLTGAPLSQGEAEDLARRLKAVADPTRLRLLSLLLAAPGEEACTCDLTEPLGLSQPT